MKRRALVLTTESARHPFRQTLPPHVFKPLRDPGKRNDEDIKLFVTSFIAFFVATYSFIA
ncbi:MAG: hypothetical protein KA533_08330 [Sphingobium sp.]|nr:hypothetical protein [Sphingobium sp.]MBP6112454.1 hypothetical protein [Sphingobium sp.]MBP8671018.1 hypothetical protein [Sphingobium sp.]MBP9158144.1 hypothetical protein [Sphingobium sp.]MCC6481201.1 hypothetical protein [Sphingomonadaceae bacterium]